MESNFDIPVVLIFFNRPDCIEQVFNKVKRVKPKKLFLVSDYARNKEEVEKVKKCRLICEDINWECEVHKIYATENLGCGKRIYTGLTEVFSIVDKAIILEDDCVPEETFFRFCKEMLEKYELDERVMSVSGRNRFGVSDFNGYSYSFAYNSGIWGWATWKRAWEKMDFGIPLWNNEFYRRSIKYKVNNFISYKMRKYSWDNVVNKTKNNEKISYWGPQWGLTMLLNNGVGIVPKYNLISNIGFGDSATHYKKRLFFDESRKYAEKEVKPLEFPLVEPPVVCSNIDYEIKSNRLLFSKVSFIKKIIKNIIFKKY